jgi:uncharacterized protein YciW
VSGHVLERIAGVPDTGPLADALATRARLMQLTQASHDAALLPSTPGNLPHHERAALAARIARLCNDAPLAAHYSALAGDLPPWATPGVHADDRRIDALLVYCDKITLSPRDAVPEDIDALRAAGLADDDIVRLAGLVAFVNYQLRVVAVLRAMGAGA